MKTKYKYIHFHKAGETLKTSIWSCYSNYDLHLGQVKWYAQWRQYVFYPTATTLYNKTCLDDISDFIKQLMEERKK